MFTIDLKKKQECPKAPVVEKRADGRVRLFDLEK